MDTFISCLLEDAKLAGIPKDEVVKAADGDVAAYITRVLEDRKQV